MTIDSVPELARRVRHLETLVKRGKPADGSDNASLLKRISALESSVARIGKAAPTKPQVYTPKPAVRVPKPTDNSLALKLAALEREVERLQVKEQPVGAWQSYTVSWTAATTNPSIGNGTLTGRYTQIGKTCILMIALTMGSTTTYGSGNWSFSLPKTAKNTTGINFFGVAHLRKVGTANYERIAQIAPSLSTTVINMFTDPTPGSNSQSISATVPFTWGDGDALGFQITYEIA